MHTSWDKTPVEPLAPSLPPRAKRVVGRVASEASRVGGPSCLLGPRGREQKRPPPLTPPRHSLREWGEGNPEICASPARLRGEGRGEGDYQKSDANEAPPP